MRPQAWQGWHAWYLFGVVCCFVLVSCRNECQLLEGRDVSPGAMADCLLDQTSRNPTDPDAWVALGVHFHMEGSTGDARTAYGNAIKLSPKSEPAAEAYLHMGIIHHQDGELEEALQAYKSSVALRSSPNTLLNMASILHQKGKFKEAIECCKRALAEDPEYFGAYAQLAILQQQNGDILEAIETYKAAIKLKPDYSAAYFNLGTAHENAGDLGSAIEQYQTAISLEGDPGRANPRFHSKLASALVEAGHLEREVSLHFDDSRHCRPLGERCKHDFHSLGVARELDASFFFNVAMVYLDTYLTFQPMPILLHWSQALLSQATSRAEAEGGAYHSAMHSQALTAELEGRLGDAVELHQLAYSFRPESALYATALAKARQAMAGFGANVPGGQRGPVKRERALDAALYARVDDAVEMAPDRYGCSSPLLQPLRVLRRILRGRSDAASLLAVHLNPLPPVRSMPPEEKVVSDPVSEVYMDGGMSGVILSNSAPDLQPYQGVIRSPNVSMAVMDAAPDAAHVARMLQDLLAPRLEAVGGGRTLDFLRVDNVSNSCEIMEVLLNSTASGRPSVVAKLVVLSVNPSVPPPVRSRVRNKPSRYEGQWGCSLAEASSLMERAGYVLVQLDYADAMFVLSAHASVIQNLPPNAFSAHQIGYANRPERLRCLGLFRSTMVHPEGDAWGKHVDPGRIQAEYFAYIRDPASYIRGNPGRGSLQPSPRLAADA